MTVKGSHFTLIALQNWVKFANMMKATIDKAVKQKLDELHKDAQKDMLRIGKGVVKSIFRPITPEDFEHAYLPISRLQGEMLQNLIRDSRAKHVVEFGTSFGISTIYLAEAVRENGGKVISTELLASKAERARKNIEEAGLSDFVEIRTGDAMMTLKFYDGPIDFLFLDGWKDLYLPLFKMLESQLTSGCIVYADNMDMAGTRPYADYILSKGNVYATETVHGGKAFLSKVL